jgi:hypothetical protein
VSASHGLCGLHSAACGLKGEVLSVVLAEIIECVETGVSIVLKGLDPIYGSLYDLLNQVGGMKGGRRKG